MPPTAADAALVGGKAEKPPKYKNWGPDRTAEWLAAHPIAIDADNIFLHTVIKLREETAVEASNAKLVEAQKLKIVAKKLSMHRSFDKRGGNSYHQVLCKCDEQKSESLK